MGLGNQLKALVQLPGQVIKSAVTNIKNNADTNYMNSMAKQAGQVNANKRNGAYGLKSWTPPTPTGAQPHPNATRFTSNPNVHG